MTAQLPVWIVALDGPHGRTEMEVPTFQGRAAAERRALVTAWSLGLGDVDQVTVTGARLADELYAPEPPHTPEDFA